MFPLVGFSAALQTRSISILVLFCMTKSFFIFTYYLLITPPNLLISSHPLIFFSRSHTKRLLKVRTCLLLLHFIFLHALFSNLKYLCWFFSYKTYFNCCTHVTLQNKTKSLHLSPLFFCEVNKNKRLKLSKTPSYKQ